MRINRTCLFLVIMSFILLAGHLNFQSSYVIHHQNESVFVPGEHIKVVSYNIRYGKGQDNRVDIQRTIQKLRDMEADIIALQEVERYSIRSGFRDQVELMAKELQMNAVFYPSLAYPGFYYGNAVFSRFPLKENNFIPFTSAIENRSMIVTQVEMSEELKITLVNTHLGLNKDERKEHFQQMYGVLSIVDGPIILTGDLNTTPEQKEYLIWEEIVSKSNQGHALKTYSKRDWQIDYIFHSPHFEVLKTETYKSDTSDHFPIAAFLLLR
jgi:endonuclease/exonuclease/phosphatase family metal-dependent hydrolase